MMRSILLCMLSLIIPLASTAASTLGYYRYPAIYDDTIVFTAEGDLWRVRIEGGVAQRLTTHHGMESHAAISPDGTMMAFSGQYEGPTEVYTMPLDGGLPTRETYLGEDSRVVGWAPAGRIVFATRHFSTLPSTQLVLLDPHGDTYYPVPLAQASDCAFDRTGSTLFFTRFAFQGSHTKRYKGGTAQNIWRYTYGGAEASPLTQAYPGTSRSPLWWEGRIYFVTDRDGTMNIWSMTEAGTDLRQHTFHGAWDVKSPDLHEGRIVYQLGADLRLYDISRDEDSLIPVTLASDFDQRRDRWVDDPMDYLTSTHISPDGGRVVLTSRGRVFVVPAKQGRFVEATRHSGVRYRDARFMPDGQSILVVSDQTGEMEFWEIPARGVGEPRQLTKDGNIFRFKGIPSPDGMWISYTDKDQKLWIYDMRIGRSLLIAASEQATPYDLTWSPDSRWLAYVAQAENYYPQILIYSLKDRETFVLTSARVDSYSPSWSPDGKWLYFLSDRYFEPQVWSPWGPRQPEPYFDKTTKIYHVALRRDARSPFQPDDEVYLASKEEGEQSKHEGKEDDADEGQAVKVEIDLDGIQERIIEVPIPAGNYRNLSVTEDHLFWSEPAAELYKLVSLEIKNKDIEPETVVEGITEYQLSLDAKKILLSKEKGVYVIDASGDAPDDLEKTAVDLSNWTFSLDPREEWQQMLTEAWRLQRDYFYDPGLHGVDWPAVLERHLTLTERVTDRDELNDLIGQMVSELSALHIYVRGGDRRKGSDDILPASLGAVLGRDERAGGYRIDHIYKSDPDYPEDFSPLARQGLDVKEGDIIQAIDGVPTLSVQDPALLLGNKAGKQVLLDMKQMPSRGAREIIVEPIGPERLADLRYDEWEYTRRTRVEEMGEGEIGYVHLRAMGGGNYSEWVRNFYPVFDRKGLIVDVRHNGGGNIDSWILEKLLRRAWFYWKSRTGQPYWNMQYAFRGHMVVLCDEWTMSDGEAFAEGFRRLGLGKIIGTRTWGGEIWLNFSNFRLVDRGIATSAQTGVYGPERQWLIEGHGVEPDIVVDNLPHATFEGNDAQLEEAIRYLQEKIDVEPVDVPPEPGYPDKSFQYAE
jgi:tricorn protease